MEKTSRCIEAMGPPRTKYLRIFLTLPGGYLHEKTLRPSFWRNCLHWQYPGEDPASRYHAIDLPLRDGANLTNNEFRISPASSINLLPDFSNMLSCHEREKKGASVSILENSIIHYLYALGCI